MHWALSSALGLALTGRWMPVCAIVYGLPDCAPRRAFLRAMDRAFSEKEHCRHIAMTYRIASALR